MIFSSSFCTSYKNNQRKQADNQKFEEKLLLQLSRLPQIPQAFSKSTQRCIESIYIPFFFLINKRMGYLGKFFATRMNRGFEPPQALGEALGKLG